MDRHGPHDGRLRVRLAMCGDRRRTRGVRVALGAAMAAIGVAVLAATTAGFGAPEPLPACAVQDVLTPWRSPSQFQVALLDTRYRLPSSYVPRLVPVTRAGFSSGGAVRPELIADLAAMRRAARAAGAQIVVRSGYRSYQAQAWSFHLWVSRYGLAWALRASARPGHSEHQLGTAIDFGSAGGPAPWYAGDWARTRAGAWMKANAWRYGFVMSYPAFRGSRTCYAYEPWHYRWVGREIAARVRASGLTLREWLWRNGSVYANPTPAPSPAETASTSPDSSPTSEATPEPSTGASVEPTPSELPASEGP